MLVDQSNITDGLKDCCMVVGLVEQHPVCRHYALFTTGYSLCPGFRPSAGCPPFFPGIFVFWHNYNFSLLLTLEWNSCQRLSKKDLIVIWGLWEAEGFVYPHFSLRYRLIFNKYGEKHWLWKDIVILKHSRKTFGSQKAKFENQLIDAKI